MTSPTARVMRKRPVALMCMLSSNRSPSSSQPFFITRATELFTNTSTAPLRATTSSRNARIDLSSPRSRRRGTTLSPRERCSSATAFRASRFLEAMYTVAPALASAATTCLPYSPAPPVAMATFPSSENMSSTFICFVPPWSDSNCPDSAGSEPARPGPGSMT